MTKGESKIISFEKAANLLDEVIQGYDNENNEATKVIFRDSAIQRFEICFDLSWKSLKDYLLDKKGLICNSPKDCFRQAFRNNIFVRDDPLWIEMTDKRNLMSHTYNENEAEKIFKRLPEYLLLFKELLSEIKNK